MLALSSLLTAAALPAMAQTYPDRPIKLVVPYTAGGATDVIGRVVGLQLAKALGQPVVVDNRAGAAGNLGAASVAREKPDGYTLLLGALTSHSINSVLQPATAGFDMEKSFTPISVVGRVPLVVVVGPSVKANTLKEFIALAKSKPGGLNYGSSGNGSPQHLAAELFKRQADVQITHVPYKGSPPALNDLMGGQVDVVFDTLPATQAFIKGGKLRALAVTTPTRQAAIPDVPTVAEAGLAGVELTSMFGVLGPAGLPEPILARLSAALKEAMDKKEVKDSLLAQGAAPVYTTPAETRQQIQAEVARWSKVIQDAGIKAD
ncbi:MULTISPECIES: tripartite tricarboxylate transporter substrate binding protein [unclassified Variovorax]|uniref:Bug family tripartite tricarboxylate transporter substrate binding protein n=1 Tax=unclassified Variovorax TaxID=663243 RepID=UPI0025786C94|nr:MULTISPECIES: tripartite tricarboxylate transporter substrate binding protein [unclassified Variovorax]MDM0089196.1 tripartite tricarboxylate transporter substrate binding protein [Variovorax sp. J22G40]MDM0147269.1 tripartite tricarboxylate transporter substrate binding protein [Variovorax sp. J2P1-31]